MEKKNIHIGSVIKQKVKEQGCNLCDFAKAIHCSRTNVHSIFKRKSIDVERLILISEYLKYNFIAEYYYNGNTSAKKIIAVLETTKSKIEELKADNVIDIIYCREVSH